MASRRYKRKVVRRDFVKTFLFLLLLVVGTVAGFLYHSNQQMKSELIKLRKEAGDLRSELKKRDTELGELKIQAVIKDSKYAN